MTAIQAFIRNHPVLTYFALTFAISWGGFILLVGPDGIPAPPEKFERMPLLAIMVMLAGPAVAGILMSGLISGKTGYRDLLARLLRWRVDLRWYAVALLAAPLLFLTVIIPLSLISPVFQSGLFESGDLAPRMVMGLVAGLIVGILEELGWTGFAIPQLRLRYGVLVTGLMVGIVWGLWHVLANDVWASVATAGDVPLVLFMILRAISLLVGGLLAFRILMVWVYDRTGGSLLVAILMHTSYTCSTFILNPVMLSGTSLLIYDLLSAVAIWAVVATVFIVNSRKLERKGNS